VEGEYIQQRLLPKLVAEQCKILGVECVSFSADWMLRLKKNDDSQWVIGYHFDINAAAASLIAKDKVAAYLALSAAGVPAVAHYLVKSTGSQKVPFADISLLSNEAEYVMKPLYGTSGYGILKHPSLSDAIEVIRDQQGEWAVSPYLTIILEKRCIVLDGNILCSYVKQAPSRTGDMVFYNLGRGAIPVDEPATQQERELAVQGARACGLRLAAVDIVTLESGEQRVLEVNSGIMMEHYARRSADNYERASQVYRAIVQGMFPVS
jgi:glutathione synthase/RimK-type ligase-like ATP-grasp enzyme